MTQPYTPTSVPGAYWYDAVKKRYSHRELPTWRLLWFKGKVRTYAWRGQEPKGVKVIRIL